jgi:signal transduction histidine kinase
MNVLSSMISLAVMSALLVVLVAVVSRRAAHTARLARRNEELAFLGRTSAELAHELKNPLAIIKSSVDVIRKKHDLDKKEKPFDFISEEVLRLSRLVDDILTFSRDRNEVFEPFYPHEVIARLSEMLGHEYPETTILDMVSENTVFKGDRDAFTRISMNLIRNSISAMNGRGEIRVAESKDRGKETLDYSDNGPGIPEDLVPRLFDPFVSGSKTGTGLGLAIVRTLCEKCKWEIRLMSHKPGNTCFRISGMIMGK